MRRNSRVAGSSGSGQWRQFLLWRNREPFGTDDPYFGRDVGFYVFELPWLHYLVDFGMAITVLSLIAAAITHYLFGGIRLQARRDKLSGAAQVHLSVLMGVFVLLKALDYWLDRFDLVNDKGSLLTGMTYTGENAVLPARNILLGIAVICAVLFFLKYGWQRAPGELLRRTRSLARFGWGWVRARDAPAAAGEVREVVRIVRVKELGDVNVSTLLSLLALAGLALLTALPR